MDFLSRQKKLQAEAKLALAMAKPMAKMQVEVEKQNRKKSPVADLVSLSNFVFCFFSNLIGHSVHDGMLMWFKRNKTHADYQIVSFYLLAALPGGFYFLLNTHFI